MSGSGSPLRRHLDQTDVQERQRAMRALLRQPLLSAGGLQGDAFALVRRHHRWIAEWLSRHTGWRLQMGAETVRLRKTPADPSDATRPAIDRNKQPFTRHRYVLLCLALAALERADRQVTLHHLAEEIGNLTGKDPALEAAGSPN